MTATAGRTQASAYLEEHPGAAVPVLHFVIMSLHGKVGQALYASADYHEKQFLHDAVEVVDRRLPEFDPYVDRDGKLGVLVDIDVTRTHNGQIRVLSRGEVTHYGGWFGRDRLQRLVAEITNEIAGIVRAAGLAGDVL